MAFEENEMNEACALAMMAGGTTGVAILAIMVSRPIGRGARLRMDAAARE